MMKYAVQSPPADIGQCDTGKFLKPSGKFLTCEADIRVTERMKSLNIEKSTWRMAGVHKRLLLFLSSSSRALRLQR